MTRVSIPEREGPSTPLEGRAFLIGPGVKQLVSDEEISAIRTKAELARRLSSETRDAAAIAGLLELAALLDADADRLENAAAERSTAPELKDPAQR